MAGLQRAEVRSRRPTTSQRETEEIGIWPIPKTRADSCAGRSPEHVCRRTDSRARSEACRSAAEGPGLGWGNFIGPVHAVLIGVGARGRSTAPLQHHSNAMGVAGSSGAGIVELDADTGRYRPLTGDEARRAAGSGPF